MSLSGIINHSHNNKLFHVVSFYDRRSDFSFFRSSDTDMALMLKLLKENFQNYIFPPFKQIK